MSYNVTWDQGEGMKATFYGDVLCLAWSKMSQIEIYDAHKYFPKKDVNDRVVKSLCIQPNV